MAGTEELIKILETLAPEIFQDIKLIVSNPILQKIILALIERITHASLSKNLIEAPPLKRSKPLKKKEDFRDVVGRKFNIPQDGKILEKYKDYRDIIGRQFVAHSLNNESYRDKLGRKFVVPKKLVERVVEDKKKVYRDVVGRAIVVQGGLNRLAYRDVIGRKIILNDKHNKTYRDKLGRKIVIHKTKDLEEHSNNFQENCHKDRISELEKKVHKLTEKFEEEEKETHKLKHHIKHLESKLDRLSEVVAEQSQEICKINENISLIVENVDEITVKMDEEIKKKIKKLLKEIKKYIDEQLGLYGSTRAVNNEPPGSLNDILDELNELQYNQVIDVNELISKLNNYAI